MAALSLEVPDELVDEVQWAVQRVISNYEWRIKQERRSRAILECDDAFFREFEWRPVVRASAYSDKVPFFREVNDFTRTNDPRRPVAMKASGHALDDRRDWYDLLMARYLRRIKYTCVDRKKAWSDLTSLEYKITAKVNRITGRARRPNYEYRRWFYYDTPEEGAVYIDGTLYTHIPPDRMRSLEALDRIFQSEEVRPALIEAEKRKRKKERYEKVLVEIRSSAQAVKEPTPDGCLTCAFNRGRKCKNENSVYHGRKLGSWKTCGQFARDGERWNIEQNEVA